MADNKKMSYLKGVRSEYKKVQWPDAKQTLQYTGIVILITILVALFCWILDIAFGWLIGLFIR